MKLFISAMLLAVLLFCSAPWIQRHLPPGYDPWATLTVDDPPTIITRYKLKRLAQDPAACLAILARARAAGKISFQPQSNIQGDCPLIAPVRVTSFGPVGLSSSFLASCPLALSSAMFVAQSARPQAQQLLGQPLARIDHLGSFACRNIYHRAVGRLSEHASADALDVSGFRLANGQHLQVAASYRRQDAAGIYLRQVFSDSCPFYGNTLGPDYNAAHANHFHLGMKGYGICR